MLVFNYIFNSTNHRWYYKSQTHFLRIMNLKLIYRGHYTSQTHLLLSLLFLMLEFENHHVSWDLKNECAFKKWHDLNFDLSLMLESNDIFMKPEFDVRCWLSHRPEIVFLYWKGQKTVKKLLKFNSFEFC